jgi:hypothetical protein
MRSFTYNKICIDWKKKGKMRQKKIVHELTSLDNDSQFNWENKLWQKWRILKKNITLKNINKLYQLSDAFVFFQI